MREHRILFNGIFIIRSQGQKLRLPGLKRRVSHNEGPLTNCRLCTCDTRRVSAGTDLLKAAVLACAGGQRSISATRRPQRPLALPERRNSRASPGPARGEPRGPAGTRPRGSGARAPRGMEAAACSPRWGPAVCVTRPLWRGKSPTYRFGFFFSPRPRFPKSRFRLKIAVGRISAPPAARGCAGEHHSHGSSGVRSGNSWWNPAKPQQPEPCLLYPRTDSQTRQPRC